MTPSPVRRGRLVTAGLALVAASLVPGLAQLPAIAAGATPAPASDNQVLTLADSVPGLSNLDTRGTALPSAAQRSAVARLDTVDVRWNQFGTPSSLLPADGSLGAAPGNPVSAARAWLTSHAATFGLSSSAMAGLELVNDQRFAQSDAHAVLFRQKFGDLTPALDSMVTVGVANGQIAYVSSSLTKTTGTPAAATLSPLQAWLKAAANVGRTLSPTDLAAVKTTSADGWTQLTVPGFAQTQQARLRALALADGSVRPVFEVNVVDAEKGSAFAYTSMVDAATGAVLHRENQVENSSDAFPFNGEITATDCGPKHEFEITDDKTKRIDAVAAMGNSADDIIVKIFDPNGQVLTTGDLGTSPETATYESSNIPAGIYSMQVCPFLNPTAPFTPPGNYAAIATTSDQGTPNAADAQFSPRWLFFAANPSLASLSSTVTPKNSVIGCWLESKDKDACTLGTGPLVSVADPGPWDTTAKTGQPTLTTVGNAANTHEAWGSPLTPGGTLQAPVSPTREYTTAFQDIWNNSKCDPSQLTPGGNDIDQSVGNLFVSHNRMHDYSYYLGFTEKNYNLQLDNLGRGGAEGDQEIGNAQAGALSGGQPSYLGRDNANQIALQDGIPGITNQYLFQPIAGAFYAPCADGSLDMGVVGHEYTHAISNRMIGGPDQGITSEQGGAMGESWGDLTASEYQFSHGYDTGTKPFVEGGYATGNRKVGIRDYAIFANPLNYSDYGFDSTGPEVHADGEIWNGTQWSVRQALVKKWNKKYPYANDKLQRKCAEDRETRGPRRADLCPGNRRWIQMIFDAFLLQQGATSMLDARDAMLASDRMRFDGSNQQVLWDAFASRGMGKGAKTKNADSDEPTPSFASKFRSHNGKVTFKAPKGGTIYVGKYEARVTPVADTVKKTKLDATVPFVAGRYSMLYVSKNRGFKRFSITVAPGRSTKVKVAAPRNLAAAASGAKVLGASDGSLNPKSLIDGTEATNWGGVNADATNVDDKSPFVVVDLAGGKHVVKRVQVSAMLNPAPADPSEIPLAADPDSGSRFTALRRFALEACVAKCGSAGAKWKRFYTSKAAAFPSLAPRPVAPDLILRSFKVKPTKAAAIRFVALENQCTGTPAYAGEQDNDPTNDTDCRTASDRGSIVHAAELQVY
ncbi:M36 family metallopeptidase [Nocardioides sp. KIGAM211]|uniref:M36 family metallopeptidase n=1 Tax=Nocardioides luti TaxID=2761101 RepID=A0A7X0RL83_9ACTN|nr:M36 family metallopeptidase [Nocardioides luti]MBB6629270.1 M36 family metallopeptidase [Nocardioides luti]